MDKIKLQLLVLIAGVLIMGIKFLAWRITGSNAILSDALESIINVVAGGFTLYSVYLAGHPRDQNHPYGHGKIEFLAAGFEGGLIVIAGLTIIVKSIYNLWNPQDLSRLDLGVYLSIATGLGNFIIGYFLVRRAKELKSLALEGSGRHLQTDAWTSAGLVLGLGLVVLTGWRILDSLLALGFAIIIIITGFRLVRKSIAGIMDEADYALIREIASAFEKERRINWIDIHNLRLIKYGSTLHIDCHMTLPWYYNAREAHAEVKALERLTEHYADRGVELFIHVDPCREHSCRICQIQDCSVRQHPYEDRLEWKLENLMQDLQHS